MLAASRTMFVASRAAARQVWRPAVASPRWMSSAGQFMTTEMTEDNIAIVTLDAKGEKVNTLSKGLIEEFEATVEELEGNSKLRAVVIKSGKAGNFIAGADIKMLGACKTAEELEQLSRNGHAMFNRLEGLKAPVVAAIDGSCLGGGLEVALACDYRIATSNSKTVLGVPEVKLGLLPGGGGTQRLPKLVGVQAALDMALTGKNIRPVKAKKMGLVNQVADPNALDHAALQAARDLANKTLKAGPKKKNLMNKILEDTSVGRSIVFNIATKKVTKNAGPHYPAPYAILKCIEAAASGKGEEGYKLEAREFGKLGMTDVSKALQGIFFGHTQCSKNPYPAPSRPISNVAVLGAGLMGAGIAQVSAAKGYRVTLKDKDLAGLSRGEAQIAANLAPKVKRRQMTTFERDTMLSHIIGQTDADPSWPQHLAKADVVIEAVFEDLGVKHNLIKTLEPMMKKDAIFATNTSAIPIADIAKAAERPENVVGMHYFSPVDKMPLLEIIPHEGTSEEACSIASAVGLKQGKTVIVVKDVPGFYVNRCLGPFMIEFAALLQEGVPIETLDKAIKSFGFPVGPVTLADEVGIDVASHVGTFLSDKLENRMDGANPGALNDMVAAGMLGRKTGKGFFTYGKGKKGKPTRTLNQEAVKIIEKYKTTDAGATYSTETIQQRMVMRFLNEAFFCLQDDIIGGPVYGDIGAVFGIGFPPFLGGPFRYTDTVGAQTVVDTMSRFADEVGGHFAPAPFIVDHAKAGKTFYPNE